MKEINLKELLEAGCHFGHEARRWHPKAKRFIYTAKNNIHIIDLTKTKAELLKAAEFVKKLGEEGKILLFVGTKKQARLVLEQEAKRVGAPYFAQRWIGGFITNWSEIKKNIDKLNQMQADYDQGKWQKFVKHEQLLLKHKKALLEKFYGGVRSLKDLPAALFVVDIKKEAAAVAEAARREIPVVAIVDTNADPTKVDYPIPANDDAVKSISFIVKYIADAYEEGCQLWQKKALKKPKDSSTENKEEKKQSVIKKTKKKNIQAVKTKK